MCLMILILILIVTFLSIFMSLGLTIQVMYRSQAYLKTASTWQETLMQRPLTGMMYQKLICLQLFLYGMMPVQIGKHIMVPQEI